MSIEETFQDESDFVQCLFNDYELRHYMSKELSGFMKKRAYFSSYSDFINCCYEQALQRRNYDAKRFTGQTTE